MSETIDELKEKEKEAYAGNGVGDGICHEGSRGWMPGLILIILGVVFLADNYFPLDFLDNWWALFILIPAVSNLSRAWRRYRVAGTWTGDARGALISGLLLTMVAVIFLFELSWSLFWPVVLILLGVGLLLRTA